MAPCDFKRRKVSNADDEDNGVSKESYGDWDDVFEKTRKTGAHKPTLVISDEREHGHDNVVAIPRRSKQQTLPLDGNIFELQSRQMLSKVSSHHEKRFAKLESTLKELRATILGVPDRDPMSFKDAKQRLALKGVQIPLPENAPNGDINYAFTYARPVDVTIVGNDAMRNAAEVEGHLTADLVVTMPLHIFQEKDYLNFRYFYKRAYYLGCLVEGLKDALSESFDMRYTYHNDNHLQPALHIIPRRKDDDIKSASLNFLIRLLLAVPEDVFSSSKMVPEKNCIRSLIHDGDSQDGHKTATPFYNATIRSEMLTMNLSRLFETAASECEGFYESCMLGSIWLRQRRFGTGMSGGGFGSFEWSYITALLLCEPGIAGKTRVSNRLNDVQLFRAVLQFLSSSDLKTSPPDSKQNGAQTNAHGPLLWDTARRINILFKMTRWSHALLREETSKTLKMLNDPLSMQFDDCFIIRVDNPCMRFDYRITCSLSKTFGTHVPVFDGYGKRAAWYFRIAHILEEALGDRIRLLSPWTPSETSWDTRAQRPTLESAEDLTIGILADPKNASRSLDKGPSAEDKEAAALFRGFWGDKAELRRFKDGAIVESLVWSTSQSEPIVLEQICRYILEKHLGEDFMLGFEFHGVVPRTVSVSLEFQEDKVLGSYVPMMRAFETLESQLRSLDRLPLRIRQISPADPKLRYSSMDVPKHGTAVAGCSPAAVCVQFEGSHRWPNALPAVQRTKIAFLLKIGELLEETHQNISARIGLEETQVDVSNLAFLEIRYSSGATFHLRIYHEHELFLLERALKTDAQSKADKEITASALSKFKREFIQSPAHTQAVRSLMTRFPLLSPSIRLTKKWRDSHLLSDHLSDELIELLVIRTFTHPHPWTEPGSLQTAFLRTLNFIARWTWQSEPLIVDFRGSGGGGNDEEDSMRSAEIEAIRTKFEAWRRIDPAFNRIALFAASNIDPDGITWTEQGPSKVVAARFKSLAQAACALIGKQGLDIRLEMLFTPSLAEYDFLIHLNTKLSTRTTTKAATTTNGTFKNLTIANDNHDERHLQPLLLSSFLKDLKDLYGAHILFFHNATSPVVAVAGIWNPQTTAARPWKIHLGYSSMPVERNNNNNNSGSGSNGVDGDVQRVELNKTGTLNDIARLGGELIGRIEVRKQ